MPQGPWAHGDSYFKQTGAELKHLLHLRNLDDNGTKKQMASRLILHDQRHPFPFMNLPVEIRCQIYMMVAAEDVCEPPRRLRPVEGHTAGARRSFKLKAIVAQPKLFRVCKEIRNEGLQTFYQHHDFDLTVENNGCFQAIMQWLRNIGQTNRQDIRYLNISFVGEPVVAYMYNMGCIHVELSDKATVIYHADDGVHQLWNIGAACERRDSRSVPIFQMWGEYGLDERFTYIRSPSFSTVPGRQVELECSLVFLPNKSWFGPGGPRSVY